MISDLDIDLDLVDSNTKKNNKIPTLVELAKASISPPSSPSHHSSPSPSPPQSSPSPSPAQSSPSLSSTPSPLIPQPPPNTPISDTPTRPLSPQSDSSSSIEEEEISDLEDHDQESTSNSPPPQILDEDEEPLPLTHQFTSKLTSTEIQQQAKLSTKKALTELGKQQAREELNKEKRDRFLSRLKQDLIKHPCYLSPDINREDLDLTDDLEHPRSQEVFQAYKIPKGNLSLRRYVLQQSLYRALLEDKLACCQQSLAQAEQTIKDTEEDGDQWVSQLDQADKNLTKVTKFWETKCNLLTSSLQAQQSYTNLALISGSFLLCFVQYLNWYGTEFLVTFALLVWDTFTWMTTSLIAGMGECFQFQFTLSKQYPAMIPFLLVFWFGVGISFRQLCRKTPPVPVSLKKKTN